MRDRLSRISRTMWIALATSFAALTGDGQAFAHALAPSLLELRESADLRIEAVWKTPRVRATGADLRPRLTPSSGRCEMVAQPVASVDAGSALARWTVDCGASGATGLRVAVEGLESGRTDAIVRVQFADGRRFDAVLSASKPERVIPARSSRWQIVAGYVAIGFQHILSGPDHLLFVLGLLLLVRSRRMLLATVTAFTGGHSVTLSLAALGIVRHPTGPIEIAIAASLVALAVELSARDLKPSLIGRYPWVMAFGFGLLHGLGFAGALTQVGLPDYELPLALGAFNLGIEIGQLAFISAVYALVALLRPVARSVPTAVDRAPLLASYAIGSLAVYWCFDRAAALM